MDDAELLAQYVATFSVFDELAELDVAEELRTGVDAQNICYTWRPIAFKTDIASLKALYSDLGLSGKGDSRFPPLYETLIMSYRWADVDLDSHFLLGNEPAKDLSPLRDRIRRDKGLFTMLSPNGYIQFGRPGGGNYDPVCFDIRRRQRNGECRIVRIDHEDIFCRFRIRETAELAPNFRSLVQKTIQEAKERP